MSGIFRGFQNRKASEHLELSHQIARVEQSRSIQHLSWLYIDMPQSSTGAGASRVREWLAPVFQARPSTYCLYQFCPESPFSFILANGW